MLTNWPFFSGGFSSTATVVPSESVKEEMSNALPNACSDSFCYRRAAGRHRPRRADRLQRLVEHILGGRRDDILGEAGSGFGRGAVHLGLGLQPDIRAERLQDDRVGDGASGGVGFGRMIVEFHAKFGQPLPAGDLFRRKLPGWVGTRCRTGVGRRRRRSAGSAALGSASGAGLSGRNSGFGRFGRFGGLGLDNFRCGLVGPEFGLWRPLSGQSPAACRMDARRLELRFLQLAEAACPREQEPRFQRAGSRSFLRRGGFRHGSGGGQTDISVRWLGCGRRGARFATFRRFTLRFGEQLLQLSLQPDLLGLQTIPLGGRERSPEIAMANASRGIDSLPMAVNDFAHKWLHR